MFLILGCGILIVLFPSTAVLGQDHLNVIDHFIIDLGNGLCIETKQGSLVLVVVASPEVAFFIDDKNIG